MKNHKRQKQKANKVESGVTGDNSRIFANALMGDTELHPDEVRRDKSALGGISAKRDKIKYEMSGNNDGGLCFAQACSLLASYLSNYCIYRPRYSGA